MFQRKKSLKVEWDACEQADRMSSMSTAPESQRSHQTMEFMGSSIGKGQHLPLCCLIDLVDQLPDPPRESIFVNVSFVAILVGEEEKPLVLALVLSFGQVDLRARTGQSK